MKHKFLRLRRAPAIWLAAFVAVTASMRAATITVTGTGDTEAVDGVVTLREAILSANSNSNFNADVVAVGAYGDDTINFNIAGAGVHTISPSVLPALTGPTVIDGYSQPGASPNTLAVGDNAVLLIELDGSNSIVGLEAGSNCTVRGLVINRSTYGISLVNGNNNLIEGNFIGTDPTGTLDRGNTRFGIEILSGSGNTIGGTSPAARNIISDNNESGVITQGSATVIRGNYIGTDRNGVAPLGNASGIHISSFAHNCVVGGSDGDDGAIDGVVGARNVISGNSTLGIYINPQFNDPLGAVTIMGNYVGLDASGSAALPNLDSGISNGGSNRTGITTIGGTAPGAGNVISANGNSGVSSSAPGVIIQGNFIGTNPSGTVAFGNGGFGIINLGINGIIGGNEPGARNLVSGNKGSGIDIRASGNKIQGNFVGTQIDGVTTLGNGGSGIAMNSTGITDGLVGGTLPGQRNIIAHNGQDGVFVYGSKVSILGNHIYSNDGLGIDLLQDGVTPNDPGDADTGPNGLQNFPVLTSVNASNGFLEIAGTLNSAASTTYRIEFFYTSPLDPSGYGEGGFFIGFTNVTTDANGNAAFNSSVPQNAFGRQITATATDPSGNTSEFSAGIGQFLNISTRLHVQTGENVLISGFIITGTAPKNILVRALGPSLANIGVPDPLPDPTLELHDSSGTLATNDDWRIQSSGGLGEITITGLQPTNDLESALVRVLPANNAAYTAVVRGKNNVMGVGVVEVYDLNPTANSKLANISTRGPVELGDNALIAGFISGNGVAKVVVRALGPTLANFGIEHPLQNPTLELFDSSGSSVATNDDWQTAQQTEIEATGLQPNDPRESAILTMLVPGNHTAVVRGVEDTTGVAVVEVYNLP